MSKRITVKVGEYTDRNGQTKARWKVIGEIVTKADGGQFVTLDATILNAACFALMNRKREDKIICSLFSDEDKAQAPTRDHAAPQGVAGIDDDIPF